MYCTFVVHTLLPTVQSGCDRKRTDGPFSAERTVRSLSITTTQEEKSENSRSTGGRGRRRR